MDNAFVPFSRFAELFRDQKTKKDQISLQADALKWFQKYYGAIFDPGNKEVSLFHFSQGLLILVIPKFGDYYYKHIFKMLHFYEWKVKEFNEGVRYYLRYEPQREINEADNPYPECNFYARAAWCSGFWYAFHIRHTKLKMPRQKTIEEI